MKRANVREPFVGPLGGWELLRLARRGQANRARQMVLYLMLIAFIITPILWFPHTDPLQLFTGTGQTISLSDAAKFANRFALVLLQAMLLAVVAMTPGYAAVALAEEKERDTLVLLLTTPLTDREIVLGKAAGRVGFVLAAAAAGLPVLALMTLFGGVDLLFLFAGCVLVTSSAVLATAIGLQAAAASADLRGALVRAYGVTFVLLGGAFIPPVVLLTPFAALIWLEGSPEGFRLAVAGVVYPGAQLILASMFFFDAVAKLRGSEATPVRVPPPRPVAFPDSVRTRRPIGRNHDSDDMPRRPLPRNDTRDDAPLPHWSEIPDRRVGNWGTPNLPAVEESNPLLWKERYVTGRKVEAGSGDTGRVVLWGFGILAVFLMFIGGVGLLTSEKPSLSAKEDQGRLVMTGGTLAAGVFLVPVAVGLAAAVTRERHRKTLDALLSLPVDRRAILRAKVWAVLERYCLWSPVTIAAAGLSFGAVGGWEPGVAAAAFVLSGSVFVIGLGTWLTVRCPTEVRAFRLLIPAVVLIVGLPVLVWNQTNWMSRPREHVVTLAIVASVTFVAGVLLWRRAGRDFNRIG